MVSPSIPNEGVLVRVKKILTYPILREHPFELKGGGGWEL